MDETSAFLFLVNALGGGGDAHQAVPQSDAEDFSRGVRFVPGEVTLARRRGEIVSFVDHCGACCWYWEFEDGTRIYHFERGTFELIRDEHDGVCPNCGNPHTSGGTINT
jgi:hypothetical protein